MKRFFSLMLVLLLSVQYATAGLVVTRSNGIELTGADGIQFVGLSGIALTGADGIAGYRSNGITLTGADGITLTGADGIALTGADGATYTGPNGIALTGADGITLTGADGITLTGTDGVNVTLSDGQQYTANSIIIRQPNGITLTGADGITLTGVDGITLTGADGVEKKGLNGITLTGADGITLTGADGITLTGADGITLTGADSVTGIGTTGVVFDHTNPTGITLTGADGIVMTGGEGITLTGADGITLTGVDGITLTGADDDHGLQGIDAELIIALNNALDDSNFNAVIVYHNVLTEADLDQLRSLGILGGTRFRRLPMVYVTATKQQLIAVSQLSSVRSIYGNRTLELNADPYFAPTGIERVQPDNDLRQHNSGLSVTGKNVTVAVLDTGINELHTDLVGRVAANVKLVDLQSVPLGFTYPIPLEGLPNTDLISGHGTFVSGIIAGSGAASNGKFAGVAPGAKLLGLSAGDINLTHVLSGFDYILDRGAAYNTRVVNCSFSSNTPFDLNDPVNVATKMLTDAGVSVVFSAGNSGAGNGTLNPYAMAPWVIGVGATDHKGALANFSSRGSFGNELQHPTLVAPGVSVAGPRSLVSITSVGGVIGADLQRLSLLELPFYTTASGTSFSAPQVAGAIALMLEANPNLTPKEIKDILSKTATPLPKYFYHEAGAGMLNTHAAVLASAFPERRIGLFRSTIPGNSIRFVTSNLGAFDGTVYPGIAGTFPVGIPANTVQATVNISWGLSVNDFGLVVKNGSGATVGESNMLNLAGLLGRREKVVLRTPTPGTYQAQIRHTANLGVAQAVLGSAEITRIEFPDLIDFGSMNSSSLYDAHQSLLMNVLIPEGKLFRPDSGVTRGDFAAAFLRGGVVPQYVRSQPMFQDVHTPADRNAVESIQSASQGRLIYDSQPGSRFYPNKTTTKLAAAIAYVRAAGLESSTTLAILPLTVTDRLSIPLQWQGHVAVALNKGFIKLDGSKFNPNRAVTRIELARSMNTLISQQ